MQPSLCSRFKTITLGLGMLALVSCSSSGKPKMLAQADASFQQWIDQSEDPRNAAKLHETTLRIVKWFIKLPLSERAEACRQIGLEVDDAQLPERGLKQFVIADEVDKGLMENWHTRPGIGVPLVVWRDNDGSGPHDDLRPPEGIAYPMTAVLEPRAEGRWRLRFLSPAKQSTVRIGEKEHLLAANYSAPLAFIVKKAEKLRRSGRKGMLNSTASDRREKLYLIDPYDPNRIPLLMVHGLQSTPVTFANLTNDLCADPELHKRYQVWHYHYPTGTPVLVNAAVFRQILASTLKQLSPDGTDFAVNHIVVIGHSMGGILSHTLTCDSDYHLWDAVIKKRPKKQSNSLPTRLAVEDVFLFKRNPLIRRVIFVAVPHRGSEIADNWIGDIGQSLFRPDHELVDGFAALLQDSTLEIDPFLVALIQQRKISSIRTLSSRSPALIALSKIRPDVPFHNIIGQKRPGPVQDSSDGIVTYTSSHLEGAESEFIVRSGHNAFRAPAAVKEIKRILHKHLSNQK